MNDRSRLPYGGAGDSQAGDRSLADRFRRHADSLVRSGRSPLYVTLMRGAAEDIDAERTVARLFEGIPTPPGSVPQLRLLAALHHLVLSGQAPGLAAFYPSAGGAQPVDGVWPVARTTIEEHFEQIRRRLRRTVQTNEPGRSAVLFAGLLWLAERHRRRIDRMRAALSVAARDPVRVTARRGSEWLPDALAAAGEGELTVVWHSVMRQYVEPEEWEAIERALHDRPDVVRLSMEPSFDRHARMQLTVHDPAGAAECRLAECDDHGLPIRWER